ncbi:hypothetical protein AB0F88_25410, partial [Streptosporangium sp. NPDC023963]|uniref:hypothetical protein n=1 Tax=Streptosporangium sp. NPDC023963 TaxID=3155608 RepID=UPI003418FE21
RADGDLTAAVAVRTRRPSRIPAPFRSEAGDTAPAGRATVPTEPAQRNSRTFLDTSGSDIPACRIAPGKPRETAMEGSQEARGAHRGSSGLCTLF